MNQRRDSRIHRWDGAALLRAALWAVAAEAALVGLSMLGPGPGAGPPHSFPGNPLAILFLLYHLPSILVAGLLGGGSLLVVLLQTALVTYLLFVRFRMKKMGGPANP